MILDYFLLQTMNETKIDTKNEITLGLFINDINNYKIFRSFLLWSRIFTIFMPKHRRLSYLRSHPLWQFDDMTSYMNDPLCVMNKFESRYHSLQSSCKHNTLTFSNAAVSISFPTRSKIASRCLWIGSDVGSTIEFWMAPILTILGFRKSSLMALNS